MRKLLFAVLAVWAMCAFVGCSKPNRNVLLMYPEDYWTCVKNTQGYPMTVESAFGDMTLPDGSHTKIMTLKPGQVMGFEFTENGTRAVEGMCQ